MQGLTKGFLLPFLLGFLIVVLDSPYCEKEAMCCGCWFCSFLVKALVGFLQGTNVSLPNNTHCFGVDSEESRGFHGKYVV